jgi:hypothetical protein
MPIVLLNAAALATLPRSGFVTVRATDPVTSGTASVYWPSPVAM